MNRDSSLFTFYKKGDAIGFVVSPLCEDILDDEGKVTGKTKCLPHSHTPAELDRMLADVGRVMAEHGFGTEAFGSLLSMQKSVTKKTGRVQHSEEAMIDFSLYPNLERLPIEEHLKEWKERYYAEGGK